MNHKVLFYFDQLQGETRALLKDVSMLSSSTYHHMPEGRWSIGQIVAHILTAELLSLRYLQKKALGIKTYTNTGVFEDLKFWVLVVSQRVPLRYKAPRLVIENTPVSLSYGEAVRRWDALRAEMKEFLERISDDDVRKKVYKHPRVGMLNVMHGIRFLREHIIHHRPQIQRIIQSVKK